MSAIEALVATIARARRDWTRDEIRKAIADAVAADLHRLSLDRHARPEQLAAAIRRHAVQQHDPAAPPSVRQVLATSSSGAPPPTEYRDARAALTRRKPWE